MRLGQIDEITLEVSGTIIERLDTAASASANDLAGEEGSEEDGDDDSLAPALALAIDVTDAAPEAPAAPAEAD